MRNIFIIAALILSISCAKKENFDATGTFESTEVIVSAEEQGKILNLNISEGDILKDGERVGTIDRKSVV